MEMLQMEHIYHIRYEHFEKGKSIRDISRSTGHDRETVKKIIDKENFNLPKPLCRKRKSKTDQYRKQVVNWLESDLSAPKKQKHTAHRVYKRLLKQEAAAGKVFEISERSIRNLVAEIKVELGQNKLASLPLLHPPGEAQVDFGETYFHESEVPYKGNHLAFTLPHSDGKYVQLFKGENFECLAQGLINIFNHIGFVPTVIRFDNMSTAVKAIKAQGEREVTEGFRRLQCHFGFESNFCNPASGHEKGSVENYVGCSRRNYFVPVPKIEDLIEYNQQLLKECDEELQNEHYKLERPIWQLFEEDKKRMKPLPRYEFDACQYVMAKTNQYGMTKFQTNSYSTSGTSANRSVTLKINAHHVTVLDEKMQPVITHKRLYGKNKESMIWGPYLDVLAQRPTALRYSGFFQGLPEPVRHFLSDCDIDSKKQILKVISQTSREQGLDNSICALTDAIKLEPKDADALICAYSFVLNKPGLIPKNSVPEHIPNLVEYEIDFTAYASLMGGAACKRK
jgi:transposase